MKMLWFQSSTVAVLGSCYQGSEYRNCLGLFAFQWHQGVPVRWSNPCSSREWGRGWRDVPSKTQRLSRGAASPGAGVGSPVGLPPAVLANAPAWQRWVHGDLSARCVLLHSSRERGWPRAGGSLLDRAALRKLNNWRQLAAIFQILRKVWFCVEQLPQTLKRELLPTVMTEGLILESRCVRLWSLFKDVLPVSEILLKGSWQLSSPAGSLNLNEIPCMEGKRVSVEIIRIGTLKPELLELKDFCVFSTVLWVTH